MSHAHAELWPASRLAGKLARGFYAHEAWAYVTGLQRARVERSSSGLKWCCCCRVQSAECGVQTANCRLQTAVEPVRASRTKFPSCLCPIRRDERGGRRLEATRCDSLESSLPEHIANSVPILAAASLAAGCTFVHSRGKQRVGAPSAVCRASKQALQIGATLQRMLHTAAESQVQLETQSESAAEPAGASSSRARNSARAAEQRAMAPLAAN